MGDRQVNDQQLLLRYVRQGSQAAFSQIVTRHLGFVYTVCRRETGDAALAEDVTQVVFLILDRKAPSLRVENSLSGWLFQTARFAAKNATRRQASQKKQEQTAEEHLLVEESSKNEAWDQIEPHYNAALAALSAKAREAVLLRFADGLSFPELGAALGASEDAARMRLNRAVSRLRQSFARAGITVSIAVLGGLLAERTAEAVPAAAAACLAGSGTSTASPQVIFHLQGVIKAMTLKKLTVAAIVGVSLALAGTVMTQAQNQPPSALPVTQTQGVQTVTTPQGIIDPEAAAVLRQSAQATAALHSLSADVEENPVIEQDAIVPPRPWGLLASLTLKRPAQVLSESPGVNGQTTFVNGKDCWFYMHWNKQYQREADLDLNTSRIGPPVFSTFFFNPGSQGLIFSGLTDRPQETRTRLLGVLPWHGGAYTAVQITQPTGHGELSAVGTLTAYFGADHLLHGFAIDVMYRGKRTVEEYALKNLRINQDVPDAKFVFVPPVGAQPAQPPVAGLH